MPEGQLGSAVVVLVFVACAVAIAAVASLVGRIWSARRGDAAPTTAARAVVTGKRVDDSGATTAYLVTFELAGGERREFAVAGAHHRDLVEGDNGELVCQGPRLVSFTPDRAREAG